MREPAAVLVPQMNVNDEQAVIVAWHFASGTHIETGSAIATLETTKATFDVHAPREGYLLYRHERKTVVPVGSVLAWVGDDLNTLSRAIDELTAPASGSPTPPPTPQLLATGFEARATRKALKRMRELGVGPQDLPAGGRIEVEDVERIAAALQQEAGQGVPRPALVGTQQTVGAGFRAGGPDPAADLCEPLEQTTSKIMEVVRLSEVYRSAVPSQVTVPLSVGRVQNRLRALGVETGPVSLLELVIHETAVVLADYHDLNGYYSAGRAWTYREVAIGFAVNAGKGLRVPVVRNAGGRTQLEVCRAGRDLTLRYFRGELSVEDVSGGTFTVTDLSSHGVTHMVPVLNDRQAAILGICAADLGGAQQNLVLTFDHRMADGMRGAEFLRDLRDRLEA